MDFNFLNSSYIIVDIPDDYIFIHKFNEIIKNNEEIFEERSYYDKLIQFNLNDWYKNIQKVKLKKNNWHQFYVDAIRSNIYINNNYVSDPNTLKEKYRDFSPEKKELLWTLCSQSAYVIPFELLNKEVMKKGYFLTELSSKDSELYNINKKMIISISDYKKKNYFVIKNSKILRIFKLENDNDITTTLVNFELEFNLNNPEVSFLRLEFRPT